MIYKTECILAESCTGIVIFVEKYYSSGDTLPM